MLPRPVVGALTGARLHAPSPKSMACPLCPGLEPACLPACLSRPLYLAPSEEPEAAASAAREAWFEECGGAPKGNKSERWAAYGAPRCMGLGALSVSAATLLR